MPVRFKNSLRFQIGAIVLLVLVIMLGGFITQHIASINYDREVLDDKQEKLKVISQGLSRGLATFIQQRHSPGEISSYLSNQVEGIINTNPRLSVGIYLPQMEPDASYRELSGQKGYVFVKPLPPPPLRRNDFERHENIFVPLPAAHGYSEFLGFNISSVKEPKVIVKDSPDGIFLGRAEPVITAGAVKGTVLVAEHVTEGFSRSRQLRKIVFFLVPGALIAGILATFLVLARLKRGVAQITTGLAEIEKDSGYRLPPPAAGELGEISVAINKMAEAVQQKLLLEEQLEKSSRLAALGSLVAGVAHEIRNPLGIIKATVQVMQDEFREQAQMQEYLTVLNEQVDRQNKIIRELLDYAKPVPPVFQVVDVNDILKNVLGFSKLFFQQHNVDTDIILADGILKIDVDVEKLKQAFLNLIFNAVEAMPEGGTLTVRTFSDKNGINIEFTDNGRGIPAADLDKLFDPFFTTKNTGTGLGLAMVHKIIELHRGKIQVSSDLSKGTTFCVILPANGPEE